MEHSAVFLDRDGTIIEDAGYIGDPAKVKLLPGAADGIRQLRQAGHLIVLVSNQSGVARGYFDEPALQHVHARLESLLNQEGVSFDAVYYCPYLDGPEAAVAAYRRSSDLRKPQPGMLFQAAKECNIDLSRSWMVGNALADVEAGTRAGCRTILLTNGEAVTTLGAIPTKKARSFLEAANMIVSESKAVAQTEIHSTVLPRDPPGHLPAGEDLAQAGETVRLLREINGQLERSNRQARQHDFSMLRLFGALLQMFAVVSAIWGLLRLAADRDDAATARFVLACFFQLASMTSFAIDRFR